MNLPAVGEPWFVEDEQEDDEEGVARADRNHETVASLKIVEEIELKVKWNLKVINHKGERIGENLDVESLRRISSEESDYTLSRVI